MRTLFGLAAVLSLAALAPAPSEACGYGIVSVFRIANHRAARGGWRSFALLRDAQAAPAKWQTLAEGAYVEPLEVADRPDRAPGRTLTLVGPKGTSKATLETSVDISGPETREHWMQAIGLGDEHEFHFAVSGPAIGLTEEPFSFASAGDDDSSWLAEHEVFADKVYVANAGTLDVLSAATYDGEVTVVRRKGELVTQAKGHAVGLLASDGARYLLVEQDRTIRPIMLWD